MSFQADFQVNEMFFFYSVRLTIVIYTKRPIGNIRRGRYFVLVAALFVGVRVRVLYQVA